MRELNIEFQECYKRLDKLCREMYDSREGVSSYIQDMEQTPYTEQRTVINWDSEYKNLKHYRWMRNQLAHEIDIDTEFCEESDVEWVEQFYERILNGTDPLALAHKAKTQNLKKVTYSDPQPPIDTTKEKPKKSLWQRIVSKIKSWFS